MSALAEKGAACYIQYPGYTFKSPTHTHQKNAFFAACGASRLSSEEGLVLKTQNSFTSLDWQI